MAWRPSGSWTALRQRARLLAATRCFFDARGLLEVETPALVQRAVTDPHLENIRVRPASGTPLFLHTSPEFHMKRMLAAGAPDIWQLGKVFRDGESGRHHEPEFTLLEWYRHDFTVAQLAAETCELLAILAREAEIAGAPPTLALETPVYWTYADLFQATLGVNPLAAESAELRACARSVLGDRASAELCASLGEETTLWLDLLMSHVVSKRLAGAGIAVITGYPESQAALARVDPSEQRVADRFEVFCRGIEVANGYRELTNAAELRRRFIADSALRARLRRPDVTPDEQLLAAMEYGLPECAGVAVGFDRVVMILLGLQTLQGAISFPVLDS